MLVMCFQIGYEGGRGGSKLEHSLLTVSLPKPAKACLSKMMVLLHFGWLVISNWVGGNSWQVSALLLCHAHCTHHDTV